MWRYSDSCIVPGVRRWWRMGNGWLWRINPIAGGGVSITRHKLGRPVQVVGRERTAIKAMVKVGMMINEQA